jgi:hypothetical protein
MRVKHSKFKDCEFVVKIEISDKMLILVRDIYLDYGTIKPDYYVYWGNLYSDIKETGRILLRTPSGRKVSLRRAIQILHQMKEAATQLTFSKI